MLTPLAPITDGQAEALLPLDEVKARLRITSDAENGVIERMRLQAIDYVEQYTGKALIRRQWMQTDRQFCSAMRLSMGPVASVEGVTYRDSSGALVELAEADWYLGGSVLHPAHGTRWPYASGLEGSVAITFTAGFEDAAAEAPGLIDAILVAIAQLFANREAPDWAPVQACADQYRSVGL